MLVGTIGAGSGGGLNLDFGVSNQLAQGKCYAPRGINQLNVSSTSNLLDVKGQADLLFQPKASGKCSYLKITDFCDNIVQRDSEKVVAQNGVTKLALSFGPEKLEMENISVYQYVIASVHILNFLVEGGQTHDFIKGIKQYLAYLIKTMELATRFEWRSVLIYDDQFRQLQALYVPWVYEIHHLHTVNSSHSSANCSCHSSLFPVPTILVTKYKSFLCNLFLLWE